MAMNAETLAQQLLNLSTSPSKTEAEAVQKFADAYATFAADAEANAVKLTAAGVALGKAAMVTALAGLSQPGNGATVLTNAIVAFWAAVAVGLATSFVGATVITPPPHAGLLAALQEQGDVNIATKADAVTATKAIAGVFYAQALIGGTVTFVTPVFPII